MWTMEKMYNRNRYFRNVKDNLKRSNVHTESKVEAAIYRTNTRKIYAQKFLKFSEIKLSIQTKQQIFELEKIQRKLS